MFCSLLYTTKSGYGTNFTIAFYSQIIGNALSPNLAFVREEHKHKS
ncbi:hypothetical protein PFLA_b0808 [Pseudoalteromonas flavipulchra NCIMB 2033 = ATCC BAA-314]|nr:hypothetical protein [Pseudoalteromonas flavipulchra NCIMB 2033 = ATCC BAA-314]